MVGRKGSGKTTVAGAIARGLRERGYRVGVVKHVHGELDHRDKDTYVHGKYSEVVGAVAGSEYAVFFKRSGTLEDVLALMDVDFVVVEGFHENKTFPRVVCGKTAEEVREMFDGLEVAVSGVVASSGCTFHVPVLDPFRDRDRLVDIAERTAFKLPNLNCGACGSSCYGLARRIVAGEGSPSECVALSGGDVRVSVDGRPLPLNPFVREVVRGVVAGLVRPLKGFKRGRVVIEVEF